MEIVGVNVRKEQPFLEYIFYNIKQASGWNFSMILHLTVTKVQNIAIYLLIYH